MFGADREIIDAEDRLPGEGAVLVVDRTLDLAQPRPPPAWKEKPSSSPKSTRPLTIKRGADPVVEIEVIRRDPRQGQRVYDWPIGPNVDRIKEFFAGAVEINLRAL